MKRSMKTRDCRNFIVEHDIDTTHHRHLPTTELSKGFAASRSSSSLDETASNSSMASSSFSLSSIMSSDFVNPRPRECGIKTSLVPPPKADRVASWLPVRESQKLTSDKVENCGGLKRFQCGGLNAKALFAILSRNREQFVWEDVEDDLFILLDGSLNRLQICREFYFQRGARSEGQLGPRRSCDFLLSMAYLLSSKDKDLGVHDEHLSRLASFLSTGRDARDLKLEVVRTLHGMCLATQKNTEYAGRIKNDGRGDAEQLFTFLTTREQECGDAFVVDLSTEAIVLLYELRAKCLRNLDLERCRIRSVADTGDNTAVIIATGAKIVEMGIQKSNKAIEGKISNAGQKMKVWIDDVTAENQEKGQTPRALLNVSHQDAVVVRAISGSTKRASEYARESSKRVAESTLDTTVSGLCAIGNKVEESANVIDQLSPENREMVKAAGKIGIASVGAVALVAEAVIETSRSLSSKTVGVTADVVGHKYGSVAGEVARDAADTYTNVLRTMGNITLASNGSKLVKTAAKNAGKNQIDEDVEKTKQMILKLERQGAMVAKQTLGINWVEGTLTKELLLDNDKDLTSRSAVDAAS